MCGLHEPWLCSCDLVPLGAKRAGADQTLGLGRALGKSVGVTVLPTSLPAGPLREVGGPGLKQQGLVGLACHPGESQGCLVLHADPQAAPVGVATSAGCVPSAF